MKYHKVGDLLAEVTEGIIVHGCNAQGVMGGGFALQVKNRYPKAFEGYLRTLDKHKKNGCPSCLGSVSLVRVTPDLYIANAITQNFYGTEKRHADYEAIARAFEVISEYHYFGSNSEIKDIPIHYPMIGAGLAGGNWTIISTIIDETLKGCDHTLWTLK